MNAYVFVPAVALGGYLILLLAFWGSKKSEVSRAFMCILAADSVWSFGSLCMRMMLEPSVRFWYYVSLCGLFFVPSALLYFSFCYTGRKNRRVLYGSLIGTGLILLVNYMGGGLFLSEPELNQIDGVLKFVYHADFWVIVPIIYFCAIMEYMYLYLKEFRKNGRIQDGAFKLITAANFVMILGNVGTVLPLFSGFPIDLFCGILNAFFLFVIVCSTPKFRLTPVVSTRMYRTFVVAVLEGFLLYAGGKLVYRLAAAQQQPLSEYQLVLAALVLVLAFILLFWCCETYLERVFVRKEEVQAEELQKFSSAVCQTLDTGEILKMIRDTIGHYMEISWLEFYCWDGRGKGYRRIRDNGGLELGNIPNGEVLNNYLKDRKCSVRLEELEFLEMPEKLSAWLHTYRGKTEVLLLPIGQEEKAATLMIVSAQKKHRKFQTDQVRYLESVASLSGVAFRNARMYAEAYREARTDALTKIGNRKAFYEALGLIEQGKILQASLILFKLDDFKVYNQLYGNAEGDRILCKLAKISSELAGSVGQVFRYSATEFAVLLPEMGEGRAFYLAEMIRNKTMELKKEKSENQMMLTVSCGISVRGRKDTSGERMLEDAIMAVYQAKNRGKNCTVVYRESAIGDSSDTGSWKSSIYREYAATFQALTAAIDAKDHYTFSHSQNVAYYAMELARNCGLDADSVEVAKEAGLLHDIGKIGIPESILKKPDGLTAEEYEIMKGHVEQSIAILRHLPSLEYVIPAVLGHHERYDGKGYPRGIKGENNPELARMLCIADAFDAMISKRAYKECYSLDYTLNQLRKCSGTQFDPELTKIFITLVENGTIQIQYPSDGQLDQAEQTETEMEEQEG